ncbi:MAG: bifunctional 5,10-methylenetetrahydrofolate dehydrogenase/5,10-methenyltetrahydrofolate cyclohydrolase [Acidimicrobiia bacterium]|nr:bifunctional 5,10-methylenetetrahydrofolate dehydrogenase/5,10-methenyltetrahydrofolate cyclohydrolase [Acidimicrobiia bacterium]
MSATPLKGKPVAARLRAEVAERVAALGDRPVGLATLLVGDDEASQVYVGGKHKAAVATGLVSLDERLPADASQADVIAAVERLNADDSVDGMIVQLPLPNGLDGEAAVEAIDPRKDADGLHPHSLGRLVLGQPGPVPATPQGIMEMLSFYDIETSGKTAVVVGRSFLVGKPMALLLGAKGVDATATVAHSRTPELAALCRTADILVAAIGRPEMIAAEFVKPGAAVIDVGINRTEDGLVGDVAYDEVAEVAAAVSPVPGGVGPLTIACLLRNTVMLAEMSAR